MLYSGTIVLFFALILLLAALLFDQFQILGVVKYSSRDLPVFLKGAALWAGQEGSLLLWAFLQALFAALVVRKALPVKRPLDAGAVVLLTFIAGFFIAMTLWFSNPFQAVAPVPVDGQGMNPLLRHPGMIFHPPVLYIGYVGLSIPFAYAISGLLAGNVAGWVKPVRSWLLMSWLALGLGIFLGARWAYDVLGWGGYWGWDAVENAGLMPWLTATALLHGLDMQSRGKGFKVWNVSLAVLSFGLVLFGTFTTRSGLIESVHAFSVSELGPYFLGLIGIILAGSLILMIVKRKNFGELEYPEKVFSREGAFFFTLLLLTLITLSVLAGTLLPTLTGGRFTASTAWFNRVIGPQFAALVLLLGVCPLLGMWFGLKQSFWKFLLPVLGMFLMGGFAVWKGFTQPMAIAGLVISGFAGGSTLLAASDELAVIFRRKENGARHHGKRIGAHLVHLGIILMAVGVIGTQMYSSTETVTVSPGESIQVDGYDLLYEEFFQETSSDHLDTWVFIPVYRNSVYITALTPKILYYPAYLQTMAKPAIRAGWGEDLYLVMFKWESSGQVSLAVMINPLSSFLWMGGFLLLLGGGIAWWQMPGKELSREEKRKQFRRNLAAVIVLILAILIFISLWGGTLGAGQKSGRPLPGTTAPGFISSDIYGNEISLSQYDNGIILVHFWATWCDQCEPEMAQLQSVWETYKDQDVQFIGVAMEDTESAVEAIGETLHIRFPLVVDPGNAITSLYGVTAVPETFIIDPNGIIAYFHIGVVDSAVLEAELDALLNP